MTFYDIDGTPYGPKEYAADKMVINQAEITGSYVPYEVKRRAEDYERGWNPFDRKYERRETRNKTTDTLGNIGVTILAIILIFIVSLIIGGIVSIFMNGTVIGEFFGNIFPLLMPAWYIIHIILKKIIDKL